LQGATVQVSDTNGNTEKYYTSTSNVVTYTDTLGATVLTATPGSTSTTYAYTGPDGNSHNYTVNYTQKTVQTYFGCSGIGEYGPTAKYLVSSVVLPDGTQYLFQYEPTPNYPNNVTGRLAQVTLPTGGTVQYAYSGGSNGISCTDYTVPTLTRTVTPGDGSAQGLWTYARTENSSTSWSTTVTDPAQNQTVIQFTASLNAGFTFPGALETERKINSGASTLMETVDTCYNNASIPCTSSSGVTLPIINRTVQTTLAGVAAKTYTTYNNYALPQVVDEYNYLLAFVRETMTCYASLTNTYIQNRPSSVVVYVSVRWTQETYCDGFHS
jgi:hypothetical protein